MLYQNMHPSVVLYISSYKFYKYYSRIKSSGRKPAFQSINWLFIFMYIKWVSTVYQTKNIQNSPHLLFIQILYGGVKYNLNIPILQVEKLKHRILNDSTTGTIIPSGIVTMCFPSLTFKLSPCTDAFDFMKPKNLPSLVIINHLKKKPLS